MNLFIESHQLFLKKLIKFSVEFIIIGGYSVIFHGYKRSTGDIDIWLKPDNTNKLKFLKVLEALGYDNNDINNIATLDFSKHVSFSIAEHPEKMDFLTYISMVKFEDADQHKIVADVDGLKVPFLHLNDLILSKINTGRGKDKADIEMLQQVANAKKQQ